MLQITRAAVGEDEDEEGNESAYVELVEYLRESDGGIGSPAAQFALDAVQSLVGEHGFVLSTEDFARIGAATSIASWANCRTSPRGASGASAKRSDNSSRASWARRA